MRKLITILALLALTACGKNPHSDPTPGPTNPAPVEYRLYDYYGFDFEGKRLEILNLDVMTQDANETLQYAVDGIQCTATVFLHKMPQVNSYNLQVWNATAVQSQIPSEVSTCQSINNDSYWIKTVDDFNIDMVRSN